MRTGRTISTPFFVAGMGKHPAQRAPDVGEHTDEALREMGVSDEERARLQQAAIVA
jgi:formyl-CoA transferase